MQTPCMKMFSIRRRTKMSKAISRRNFLMATGAVGAAGLLAACGSKPAASSTASSVASQAPAASADESLALSDGPVNLSISWWGGDSRHAAYQSALEAFQAEHSNITVEPTFAAWSGWEEKMAAAFIAGNAQDVCQVNWNWLYNYSADGSKFVDLNTTSKFIDLTQWDAAAMDACYVANSQQCVPVSMTGRIFFWNMTTFNKAGITEVPTTWDAFLADCEAIKANGISPVYYSGVDTWTLQFFALMGWYSDYAPEDAQAFADAMSTNQKHWSDMNGFIDSIGKIKELVDLGYVQETYLSDTYQQAQQALLDGTCAFYAQGDWVVGELEKIDADKTASSIGAFLIPLADHLYCGVGVNKGETNTWSMRDCVFIYGLKSLNVPFSAKRRRACVYESLSMPDDVKMRYISSFWSTLKSPVSTTGAPFAISPIFFTTSFAASRRATTPT